MIRKLSEEKPEDDEEEEDLKLDDDDEGQDEEKAKEDKEKEVKESPYIKWYKEFFTGLKMGVLKDDTNQMKLFKLLRFKTTKYPGDDDWVSIDDYVSRMHDWQAEIYYAAGESIDDIKDSDFMEVFKKKDVEVLYFTDPIDEYMTNSGKTSAYLLPILHTLSLDPYGIYCLILLPTRELARQVLEQIVAFGSPTNVRTALVTGGSDQTFQCNAMSRHPHFVVATPGRLAEILRRCPDATKLLRNVAYLVLDEADRLLQDKGFELDVEEILNHLRQGCRKLLFSATMTGSLKCVRGMGRLETFVVQEDGKRMDSGETEEVQEGVRRVPEDEEVDVTVPSIPAGLAQEYIFMPSRVRDAYLAATVRTLMAHGGRARSSSSDDRNDPKSKKKRRRRRDDSDDSDDENEMTKPQSAIIFCPTCERTAQISGLLTHLGVDNIALHSLLSQNRRIAALEKFKSHRCRVLIGTDLASRGLDVPHVDLVINLVLPRKGVDYVHRIGRTARAGRRGRAVSLVGESEVSLVQEAERVSGRVLEKCGDVTEDVAMKLLGTVTKAMKLVKMKLAEVGFDEAVRKQKERKRKVRKERERLMTKRAKVNEDG